MLYFKSFAILMPDITNNLAPQNISRLFNATDQVHAFNTSSSSGGDYEIGRWLQNRLSKRQSLSTKTVLYIQDYVHPDDQTQSLIFTLE